MSKTTIKKIRENDILTVVTSRRFMTVIVSCFLFSAILPGTVAFSLKATRSESSFGIGGTGEEPSLQGVEDGLFYSSYRVEPGDMLSVIAEKNDVSVDTIVSLNSVKNSRALGVGQLLKIPSMSGILYSVKPNDTIESIATAYKIDSNRLIEVNRLVSETLTPETPLFLPDAKLASFQLREINGDLFRWPISGWLTSYFGWRKDPLTGNRIFHNGIDVGAPMGTKILAAMEGTVSASSYSVVYGNYVILSHHSGYSSMYAHMTSSLVKPGQHLKMGQALGIVGNTGYSTGTHLHFSVFKNGRALNPINYLH